MVCNYIKIVKKFDEFVNDNLEEGYLRRVISSEINKEERTEDKVKRERNEKIKKIKSWLDGMGVENYTIDEVSLKIDVNGDVSLRGKVINGELVSVLIPKIEGGKLPDYIKFRKVKGNFNCSHNDLTSLEGCPEIVEDTFYCLYNQLTSLEGCPKEAKGGFDCSHNKLTSLKGCPDETNVFNCSDNKLKSLEGCPKEVDFLFCSHNQLTSIEHCPKRIDWGFNCSYNQLTSLEGCPDGEFKYVFDCSHNNLTSLEGCPKKVYGDFECSCDCVECLETGYDEKVKVNGEFILYYNRKGTDVTITEEDIMKHFDVGNGKITIK